MIKQSEKKIIHVCIYSRCSHSESTNDQDTEVQLKELRRYCEAYNWSYDEVSEYGSGFKTDTQPKLDEVLEKIRLKHYDVLICYSMDRFSRQSPSYINHLLDVVVEKHKCRFIALQQGIDSDNELTWHVVKPLFTYFANKFSKDLGEKIKKGIQNKKDKGKYTGGRPSKQININEDEILKLRNEGLSLRGIEKVINNNLPKKERISYGTINRVLQKLSSKLT